MGTILGKEGLEQVETELAMTSLPDMIFSSNFLTMRYKDEFEMKFSARDALNTCDKTHCPDVQVAAADSWIYGWQKNNLKNLEKSKKFAKLWKFEKLFLSSWP